MTRKRWELAVAAAAAWIAFARAFLPGSPLLIGAAAVAACAAGAGALALPWRAAPPRVVRWARLLLRLLLVVVGGLVVFARQFPLVRDDNARLTGVLAGSALALLTFAFLAGQRVWRVHTHLVPAVIGVLVAAGMERTGVAFPSLAALAGLALWLDAFRTGGPRRWGLPALATGLAAAALTAAIAWALPVAQPLVQDFVARAYSEGQTGLSDHSQLGDVASLARSRRVVARVWTDRPQPLRIQVFARFDGRHWAAFPSDGEPMRKGDRSRLGGLLAAVPGQVFESADEGVDTESYVSETRVMPALWMSDGWGLLAPAGPGRVVWPHEGLALDGRGLVRTGGATAHLYGVSNRPLAHRGGAPTRIDLTPPLRLDPRVRALAERLRRGEPPGPALVERTIDHLRTDYRYTLEVGRFQTADPLAEFLFDKRAGYCEYFATAAVVLLRLQGVPARYVKGVSVRADRRIGAHYVVRESDAHAWADVWTNEGGWTEVDPTPVGGWSATHADEAAGTFEVAWELGLSWAKEVWARWRQETWPWLTDGLARAGRAAWDVVRSHPRALAAVGAAGALLLLLARRRTPEKPTAAARGARLEPDLARVLRRVERHWTRAGQARPSSRGLVEHLSAMPEDALSTDARALSRRVVEAVYASAFSGRPPAPDEIQALDASTRALPR